MCASMADIHSATAEIRRGKKEAEELECGPMPKIAMGTIAQLCRAISSQLRHVWTIEKNVLSSNMSSTCPCNMVNFGLLAAEMDPVV